MKKVKFLSLFFVLTFIILIGTFSVSAVSFESDELTMEIPAGYEEVAVEDAAQGTEYLTQTQGFWLDGKGNMLKIVVCDNYDDVFYYDYYKEVYQYNTDDLNSEKFYADFIGYELIKYESKNGEVASYKCEISSSAYKNLVDGSVMSDIFYKFYTKEKIIRIDLVSSGETIAPELLAAVDTLKLKAEIYTEEAYNAGYDDDYYDDYEDYIENGAADAVAGEIFDELFSEDEFVFGVAYLVAVGLISVIIDVIVIVLAVKYKKKQDEKKRQFALMCSQLYGSGTQQFWQTPHTAESGGEPYEVPEKDE